MPFGLSNLGSSFCRLMEMCVGDQQFVTVLLYLDDNMCFEVSMNGMLDRIEIVFRQLKDFKERVKSKKCQFFQCCIVFLEYVLSVEVCFY